MRKKPNYEELELQNRLLSEKCTELQIRLNKEKNKKTSHPYNDPKTLFCSFLEAFKTPVFCKNMKGEYIACNYEFTRQVCGVPNEQLVGKTILEINQIPPKDAATYNQREQELLQNKKRQEYESYINCHDDITRLFKFVKDIIYDNLGKPVAIIGVMEDITRQKKDEEELNINLNYQQFLSEITYHLLNVKDFSIKINFALNLLGKFLNVYGIFIYHKEKKGDPVDIIYKWISKELSYINQRPPLKEKTFIFLKNELRDKGMIYSDDISSLHDELYEFYDTIGVKTILILPIITQGSFYGFISFEECIIEKRWNSWEIRLTRIVANMFSTSFEMMLIEKGLKESEEKFRSIFNNSADAIYITDFSGSILEINQQVCERTGFKRKVLLTKNLKGVVSTNENNQNINKYFWELKKKKSAVVESEYRNNIGNNVFVEISGKIIDYEKSKAIMHISRNITERKLFERKIMSTVIQTEEKERSRFAKDLHDGLGALLSGINMYINLLNTGKLDEDEKENIIKQSKGLINQAIASTREIANNIRPHVLSNFGLVASIEAFCEQINNTNSVSINFNPLNFNATLNYDIEIIIYRIVNELINNSLKHASAKTVTISLFNKQDTLFLYYNDDGTGFNIEETLKNKPQNMGIRNIISRLDSIHAIYEMYSSKGTGFSITIEVCLDI